MPVTDLQLEATTSPAREHRAGHAVLPGPGDSPPPDGGTDKGYTAGTSSDVSVSTGFAFTSPESAAGALPVGAACSGDTRVIA